MHVWPEQPTTQDDHLHIAARLELDGVGIGRLTFELPAARRDDITQTADPFLIGSLFLAMRKATKLRIHGTVSPSLLANLDEFQSAWSRWMPNELHPVEIEGDFEAEEKPADCSDAIMTFSGGLDSCFTAWRHAQNRCGRRRKNIRTALMVHGFDIPIAETDVFRNAAENSRRIVETIGMELIPIACNFRSLGDDWEMAHGAALAASLHLFRKRFSCGVIAGSHAYDALRFPWGSNPLTDPMLSSTNFPIVYDAAEFSRREKAREVAEWSAAMERMRVCWEGEQKDRNCGRCVRCVGTAICFAIEGKPLPASLPVGPLDLAVQGLFATRIKPVTVTRLAELAEAARSAGIRDSWVETLENCVRMQRGRANRPLAKARNALRKGMQLLRSSAV